MGVGVWQCGQSRVAFCFKIEVSTYILSLLLARKTAFPGMKMSSAVFYCFFRDRRARSSHGHWEVLYISTYTCICTTRFIGGGRDMIFLMMGFDIPYPCTSVLFFCLSVFLHSFAFPRRVMMGSLGLIKLST